MSLTSLVKQPSLWVWLGVGLALLGLLVVFWRSHPALPPNEASPEVRFARDMMAHHAQAVEMALLLRERTQDQTLRTFALDIVLTQQAQIGQMQGWLAVWGLNLAGLEPPMQGMAEQMGMAKQSQIEALRTMPVPEAETQFLQLMIRHHQGGVAMAQSLLGRNPHRVVRRLAESIVQGQQSEIEYMRGLLKTRQVSAPEPPPMNHPQMGR